MQIQQLKDAVHSNIPQFILQNRAGTRVQLCAAGASISAVHTADRTGNLNNIALPSASRGDCAGATVGPVAGRIAAGRLPIDTLVYPLTTNDGANTLHGGPHGLAHRVWACGGVTPNSAVFTCTLPDGLDGFPGNRCFRVSYTLDETNTLSAHYTATTDKATFVNLTNHTYWNLRGDFSGDAYGQTLQIMADSVLYNDAAHLPVAAHPVRGTAFDFTAPRMISDAMGCGGAEGQLSLANGYNNAYLLRGASPFAAILSDPVSGRCVCVSTDYPCLVLYSGGFLPIPGCALALEAQFPPNTCTPVLRPGEFYSHRISFHFT